MSALMFETIQEKVSNGDLAGALQALNQMAEIHPDSVEARWHRSGVHLRMRNFEQALDDLDWLVQREYKLGESLSQRAFVRLQLQDYAGAIADSKVSAQMDSSSSQNHLYEGLALFHLGEYAASIPCFSALLDQVPTHQEGQRLRGMAYCLTGQFQEGLFDMQSVLAMNQEDDQAWFWLGFVRHQEGDFEAALQALDESIRRNGYNKSAYVSRGRVWLAMGEKKKALKDFESAHALDPDWEILPALVREARRTEGRGGIFGALRDLRSKHER
ncbi:MAG: tetratricopeptide repeat protein [Haliscomenobacter sp.]